MSTYGCTPGARCCQSVSSAQFPIHACKILRLAGPTSLHQFGCVHALPSNPCRALHFAAVSHQPAPALHRISSPVQLFKGNRLPPLCECAPSSTSDLFTGPPLVQTAHPGALCDFLKTDLDCANFFKKCCATSTPLANRFIKQSLKTKFFNSPGQPQPDKTFVRALHWPSS